MARELDAAILARYLAYCDAIAEVVIQDKDDEIVVELLNAIYLMRTDLKVGV